MLLTPQALDAPILSIIDEAIQLIETGEEKYTCHALDQAVYSQLGHWSLLDTLTHIYKDQYRRSTYKTYKGLPMWWNNSLPYREERIQGLKAFKQACIKAGRKNVLQAT